MRTSSLNLTNHSLLLTGFLISFLGSLPPGTTNIILIDIAGTDHITDAILFSLGCFLAELVCVKLCLSMIHGAFKYLFLEKFIHWLSLAFLILLSVASFMASSSSHAGNAVDLLPDHSPFFIGFVMMIFNPVQIPFWLSWTVIVLERRTSTLQSTDEVLYLVGIGVGSLLASALFIVAGQLLSAFFLEHQRVIHFVLGCAFAGMAVMQVWRRYRKTS